ncbi:WS/DGAT/MGAT family O-acyltransferase [Mycobacterium branderi]|uniref:Diacylglycerol O-acyltransferase n=1 Tax=Mycobacterium branderi TaxID=43348 RepID=A0A7I7W426_9MYCO|nr:wax ester/triacylglycerol synthase family O-acyltransferase [Mycobacterium branderi]MCV7231023.1 wax ester/triacylglycerol synthase family O-acyltransferase [Mycobacterium branderi]ORA38954.1 diacylglycerol O-acyltransferase [Mycobacterium branderi]BBZ12316.1 diacylglycerol O-acyltransferase [Mycobacterium branderi]
MERLSGLDASFLYTETHTQPLNVCSVVELDTSTTPGGYTFDRLRDGLEQWIKALPELRAKLADSRFNLDHPVWADDTDFDIERHLKRIRLPAQAGRHELAEICGRIAGEPLDRRRPLWEMWVIEDDTDGQLAAVTKAHHAAVDGILAANLFARLCSSEPEAPPPDPVDGLGRPSRLEIAADGLLNVATRPLRLAGVLSTTATSVVTTLRRARAGQTMAAPFAAPKCRFNAAITSERAVAFTQLKLADVKAVKNRFGVKVNDVVMALCAGALRRLLAEHGELPKRSLVAMVPVSVHGRSNRSGRNQVSGMFCRLLTQIEDPVERLRGITHATAIAKDHSAAIGPTLLQDWTHLANQPLFNAASRLYPKTGLANFPVYNLIISNVPGPQAPLYFLGAQLKAMYPLGPIFHSCGLNITVMSLDGTLNVGILACPRLIPDVWKLADNFPVELAALLRAP